MDQSHSTPSRKAFTDSAARRDALRALSAAAMALLAALGVPNGGEVKKKNGKNNKNRKKKCKSGTKKCGKRCIPATDCCTDADCDGGSCIDGTCQCLGGSKPCEGACIPEDHCCSVADCDDDGNPCTAPICNGNGTCSHANKPDLSYCGGNNACSGGVCATPPTCVGTGWCISHSDCCSNNCEFVAGNFNCFPGSNPGQPCESSDFCINSSCVGFVCKQ